MKIFHYFRESVARMRDALRDLQQVEQRFVSSAMRKNLRKIRPTIIVGTIILMATPWVFGELIDYAIVPNSSYVSVLLAIIVTLIVVRIRVNLATFTHHELNVGDTYMNIDRVIGRKFVTKNIKQLEAEKLLSAGNINKARGFVADIVGDLRIAMERVTADLVVAYIATLVGSIIFKMPLIGIMSTIGLAAAVLYSSYLNTKVLTETVGYDEEFRGYNRSFEEFIQKAGAFKAQGMDDRIVELNESTYQDIWRRDRIFWLWYIKQTQLRALIVSVLIVVTAYIIGVYHIMQNTDSLPLVIALFSWGGIQVAAIRELARTERSINKRLPAVMSLIEALDLPEMQTESGTRRFDKHQPFSVLFENVSHWYEDEDEKVLSNINVTIGAGQKWALVGESGSGKSTLVKLLIAAMPPKKGRIVVTVDDERIDLWDLDLQWWRSEVIGYVPQDVVLKDGTIRDNLLLAVPDGRSQPSDAELLEMLSTFDAIFKNRSNEGSFLDVQVGRDGGVELSGGQRQRIGIARAVLRGARFIIFDEATSSLDAKVTNNVTRAFKDALSPDITAVIIAHDISTLAGGSPSKLLDPNVEPASLVCDHYWVIRPAETIKLEIEQVDYVGPVQGLRSSEVMVSLINEAQKHSYIN